MRLLKLDSLLTLVICKLASLVQDRNTMAKILRCIIRYGPIEKTQSGIIDGTLKISEMQVREIMVPRAKMTVVPYKSPLKKILPDLIASTHSRFPVVNKEDKVVGMLLAKDLLPLLQKDASSFNPDKIMRPPIFIPESKRLNVLLEEFRSRRIHMAIVLDEHSLTAGLVTIEDVLEEIVGQIEDEHDRHETENTPIAQIPFKRNIYKVKANTPLNDFNAYFATALKHHSLETIGGLVLDNLKKKPRKGDSVRLGNMTCKVARINERRIEELIISQDNTLRKKA